MTKSPGTERLSFGGRILLVAFGVTAALSMGLASQAEAQKRAEWENLGCAEVGRRPDRDIIDVGAREGWFKAIRLQVTGNDVEINDLKVVYGNGASDDLQVRSEFREGTTSRAIDLKGKQRKIKRIEIVSRRDYKGRGRGRARICITGLQADDRFRGKPGRRPVEWEELGCQKVGFLRDRDSIQVGRKEGRFKAIRLLVSRNDIHINGLTVVYGNGQPDRIAINQNVRENGKAGPFDLRGRERVIQRIDMDYRSRLGFGGSARVCVEGQQFVR